MSDMPSLPMWGDPSFEEGQGPIPVLTSNIERVTDRARTGTHSIRYTSNGSGGNVYGGYGYIPVTAGRTYTISAWVNSDSVVTYAARVHMLLADGTVDEYLGDLNITTVQDQWTYGEATFTPGPNVTTLRYASMIAATSNDVAGRRLWLDDFELADVSAVLPMPGEVTEPGVPIVSGWTDAEVSGDRVNVHEGPIVAGDRDGARVEVAGDGLHAYDATGTETAHIKGEGGEFVGGSFRTSDENPGQVTLSDTAFGGGPGIEVEPVDPSGFTTFPGLGPSSSGLLMSGGRGGAGSTAAVAAHHDYVSVYHNGPGSTGSGAWVEANGTEAKLTYRSDRSDTSARSQIRVTEGQSVVTSMDGDSTSYFASFPDHVNIQARQGDRLGSVAAGLESVQLFFQSGDSDQGVILVDGQRTYLSQIQDGVARYLIVNDSGVWVQTNASGQTKSYNLEETAQDSGWQSFPVRSGITGSGVDWRNKNGVCYYRGTVSSDWSTGWNLIVSGLNGTAPDSEMRAVAPVGSTSNYLLRMTPGGGAGGLCAVIWVAGN